MMYKTYNKQYAWQNNILVFWQLFQRDVRVHLLNAPGFFINYGLVRPLLYAFAFAYLQANALFGANAIRMGTVMFVGNAILIALVASYQLMSELLYDLEGDRFVSYQLTLLNPRVLLIERILFTAFFSFLVLLPFYPVAKLFLQAQFDTSNCSYFSAVLMLLCGSLCSASYSACSLLALKSSRQIGSLWSRYNNVLLSFGGFWVPLHIITAYWPLLGGIIRYTPFVYFSEGLRQAVIGGPDYLSIGLCISMLMLFSLLFTAIACWLFQRWTDHI